jgi:hypothetical protein
LVPDLSPRGLMVGALLVAVIALLLWYALAPAPGTRDTAAGSGAAPTAASSDEIVPPAEDDGGNPAAGAANQPESAGTDVIPPDEP